MSCALKGPRFTLLSGSRNAENSGSLFPCIVECCCRSSKPRHEEGLMELSEKEEKRLYTFLTECPFGTSDVGNRNTLG